MRIALIDHEIITNSISKRKFTKEIERCEVISFFNAEEALDYRNTGSKINIALFAEQGVEEEFFIKHDLYQVLKKLLTMEIIELITRD